MRIHPLDLALVEFASRLTKRGEEMVTHLADCRRCRQRVAAFVSEPLLPRPTQVLPWRDRQDMEYEGAIAAAERRMVRHAVVLEAERDEAPGRVAELLAQLPERRGMLMRNHRGFRTWGLLELVVERIRQETFENPGLGEDLSRLALSLADSLDVEHYGQERIADLRARTWGYLGNNRRVRFDLAGAELAFEEARCFLRAGTGDPLERALLLDLWASLLRDQRKHGAALQLLRRVRRTYLRVGETHRAGRVLIKMATVHEHAGTPEAGIPLLFEAFGLIDCEREPRLHLMAAHNLITCLVEAGRCMEAHGLFIKSRPVYSRFHDSWTQNRRHWVAGKIARGLGQMQRAETHLQTAQTGFISEGAIYDTALVSLELALMFAEQGRTRELKQIAEEMLTIFASQKIHREALAALSFLHQAAAAERASIEVIARVTAHFKGLRYNPELTFEPPK